jgi:hypothetical protein
MAIVGQVVLNVTVEPLYDTSFIPTAGSAGISFFATPMGQGVSNWATASTKTLADTNMDLAGVLAAGNNFSLLGFRLLPSFNMTIADATLAFNGAVFQFILGNQTFLQTPCRTIPAGMGVYIGGAGATTTAGWGWQDIHNGFKIGKQPLNLAQTQNFAARITWPGGGQAVTTTMAGGTTAGAAGLPVTILLDGFRQRLPQ